MAISHILVVSVPVTDQQRAKAFYIDKLGFELQMEAADAFGPGTSWIAVGPKGGQTSLTLVTWFDAMPAGSLRGLVLETPIVDEDHARLAALGVDIGPLQDAPWGRYATLNDSEGNQLILQTSKAI